MTTTRRKALELTGTSLAAIGGVGHVAARDGTVRANVGYDAESGRQAALAAADEVIYEFGFDALTLRLPEAAMDSLAGRPGIRYVERDREVRALAQGLPWGVDRIDADVAHATDAPVDGDGEPETGDGVDVAIIDTGIDSTHPDLEANLGEGKAFVGTTENPEWQDDNGHGTHCAGIADAVDNDEGVVGVSTEATLHAVKVLTATGVGLNSDVARGIEYTADQGWDVGSLSLGGGPNSAVEDAVAYADERDVLLVAAAGNDGPCSNCVTFPAAYPECVAVSATNRNDGLADFSSQGPEVELAAPGDAVCSTYTVPRYETLSGTSMACPHVSGAGAQLRAHGLSADEARQRLHETAEDVDLSAEEQGYGLVDVAAALGLDSSDDGTGHDQPCL
jgi:subtilisin